MNKKINLDQDLALYYPGGSGGFLFFYILLLFKKHIVGYDLDVLELFKDRIHNLKIHYIDEIIKKNYELIAGVDWPSYDEYVSKNYIVSENISIDIKTFMPDFIRRTAKFEFDENYELILDNLDLLIDYQWQGRKNYWKDLELQPCNNITEKIKSKKYKNKIYFYRSGNVDGWKNSKCKKILFYADFKTQLRMSLYKKAKWFDEIDLGEKRDTKMSDVKNVLKRIKTTNGISQEVHDLSPYADYNINLSQLIHNPEEIFETKINSNQINLIKHWMGLHPTILLKKTNLI